MDLWNVWTFGYLLLEWTIRVVMLVYVPQRRNAAAARAWLLFIFFLPWLGLIVYAVVGRAYLSRRRIAMHKEVIERLRTTGKQFLPPSIEIDQLPSAVRATAILATNLGRFGPVGGNQLELLHDYDDALSRLIADIENARHHVHLL